MEQENSLWESPPKMKLFVDMEKQSWTTYPLFVDMFSNKMLEEYQPSCEGGAR